MRRVIVGIFAGCLIAGVTRAQVDEALERFADCVAAQGTALYKRYCRTC